MKGRLSSYLSEHSSEYRAVPRRFVKDKHRDHLQLLVYYHGPSWVLSVLYMCLWYMCLTCEYYPPNVYGSHKEKKAILMISNAAHKYDFSFLIFSSVTMAFNIYCIRKCVSFKHCVSSASNPFPLKLL